MHNCYLQRGFQIVFVKGDGEFKPDLSRKLH